jgi:hypothetical protein
MIERAKSDQLVMIEVVDEGGGSTRGGIRRSRHTNRIHATPQWNHSNSFVLTNGESIANIGSAGLQSNQSAAHSGCVLSSICSEILKFFSVHDRVARASIASGDRRAFGRRVMIVTRVHSFLDGDIRA